MEGLRSDSAGARYVAPRLGGERFTLIDIGCSGGIDRAWRLFGGTLRAFGFDPDVEECARLNERETLAGVEYLAALVAVPADDPHVQRRGSRPYVQRNPWNRLSAVHSLALRQPSAATATAEKSTQPAQVVLPQFLRDRAIDDIDVLKIDIDGADFDLLQSLAGSIRDQRVLAVGVEVNFIGSHDDTDHTFHNTDRFMRRLGFDLFSLTVRPYSVAALPARYQQPTPAKTQSGRPLQGDALYVLDLGNPDRLEDAAPFSAAKLAKLSAIYACFGLYDCAAEVLVTHRQRIAALLNVDEALNVLCAEAQGSRGRTLSYQEYIDAFRRDDPRFYPASRPE